MSENDQETVNDEEKNGSNLINEMHIDDQNNTSNLEKYRENQ